MEFKLIKERVWTKNGKDIPINELTDAQLRKAKLFAQSKELFYHNKASVFSQLVDWIEEEAESRELEIPDYDREFFKNKKVLKDAVKKDSEN